MPVILRHDSALRQKKILESNARLLAELHVVSQLNCADPVTSVKTGSRTDNVRPRVKLCVVRNTLLEPLVLVHRTEVLSDMVVAFKRPERMERLKVERLFLALDLNGGRVVRTAAHASKHRNGLLAFVTRALKILGLVLDF